MKNDFQISKHFNLKEFECTHSNHEHVLVDNELVEKLEELREQLGQPIIINSAYRCPERNEMVGGAEESYHLEGMAVDISMHNLDYDIKEIRDMAIEIGFGGIGLYNTFIHLDTRLIPARWGERH